MAVICPNPEVRSRLDRYRSERDALLHAFVAQLEQDDRVVAVWLFGSLGRDDGDELSDLDLVVVVNDLDLQAMIARRSEQMACVEIPLLVLDAPQNRPPGGAYNMALYPGVDGPHQVDWYWAGQSATEIPQQTRVLFDRAGLPRLDQPIQLGYQPVPERSPAEVTTQGMNFCWVMLLIAAKYVARSPLEEGMGLAEYARNALRESAEFCDAPYAGPSDDEMKTCDPAAKVQALRSIADAAIELFPQMEARGATPPTHIVEPARRYLDLIAAITTAKDEG